MKLFVTGFGALALAISLMGTGEAVQPNKGGRKVIRGHNLVSRDRMGRLRDGKHHVHNLQGRHKVHVHTRGGKLSGMHVTDHRGRNHTLRPKVVRSSGKKGRPVSLQGGNLTPTELAALRDAGYFTQDGADGSEWIPVSTAGGVQILVVFVFQDPFTGQTILFVWPVQSCSPTILPPGAGDPDDALDDLGL
jgi:hypothetical protein